MAALMRIDLPDPTEAVFVFGDAPGNTMSIHVNAPADLLSAFVATMTEHAGDDVEENMIRIRDFALSHLGFGTYTAVLT